MKYEIHNDRIIMREEGGKAVAQIQYPEVGKGVCEIAHIYGENSAEGRKHADLLMEMAVAEIRKGGRKLIPGCAFASHWFARHPEEQDVVTDWDTLRQMEQSLYGEPDPTKEMTAVKRDAERQAEKAKQSDAKKNSEKKSDAKKAEREEKRRERIRQEEEEKRQAILEDALEEEERARVGEERLNSSLKVVLRVLQVISLLCMLGVLGLFLSAAITQKVYVVENFPQMVCLGLSAFLVVFCVIQLFWIMSRKRMRDDFGNPMDEKYDTGRGVFGFILVIIICFVCGLAVNYVPDGIVDLLGLSQFSGVYQMRIMPIIYAAIAGFVLCLIRKIAGRQMVR